MKHLNDTFFQSRLTEEVWGHLSSRIALHYLLPELTQAETRAISAAVAALGMRRKT